MISTKQSKQKVIFHIDYDSFFASVEQQANPFLRGKPIAITGSKLSRSICSTASIQAKKFGVKTGMPFYKAKQLCPDLIPVRGDFSKYTHIHKESIKIFKKYTDLIEPFSIDEAFLDLTQTYKFFGQPIDVAKKIKADICAAFGPVVTCSVGIGPNKLLAKLVSDLDKPNGIFEINQDNLNEVLYSVDLTDFCGIGPRIHTRLNKIGVYNVKDLQKAPFNTLLNEFGNVYGLFLKNLSLGISFDEVKHGEYKRTVKSVSHQHTLHANTKDQKVIKANLRRLSDMVVKRLRKHNMAGKTIFVRLRDSNMRNYFNRRSIYRHTDSPNEIFKNVLQIYDEMNWTKETRLVGMGISNLIPRSHLPKPLFIEDQKEIIVEKTIEDINNKFGRFTVIPAGTLKADPTKYKVSSFLKHG